MPARELRILEGQRVLFVYAAGHPPLVLTHEQVEALWRQTTELRVGHEPADDGRMLACVTGRPTGPPQG